MGKWTYHTTHSFKNKDGKEVSFVSQLYRIGVYAIINNDPAMQINTTPSEIVKMEKKLLAQQKKGKITDLIFGNEITVSDDTGFYQEVKPTP